MKIFKCDAWRYFSVVDGIGDLCELEHNEAFDLAPESVHGALDALKVGETAIDEEGDTWRRIA